MGKEKKSLEELKTSLAYWKGKAEVYPILYAATNDNRHKKFLESAKEHVTEYETLIKEKEAELAPDGAVIGILTITAAPSKDKKDISVEYSLDYDKKYMQKFGNYPILLGCAAYIGDALIDAIGMVQNDPGDREFHAMLKNAAFHLKRLSVDWVQGLIHLFNK